MRLWTLHPRHLDAAGLVALWREALLAQAVLLGRTRGYTRHPQLQRFRAAADPVASIGAYLRVVADEATSRGYAFDATRIVESGRLRSDASPRRRDNSSTNGSISVASSGAGRCAWYRDRIAGRAADGASAVPGRRGRCARLGRIAEADS